jgi:hypothetical protein
LKKFTGFQVMGISPKATTNEISVFERSFMLVLERKMVLCTWVAVEGQLNTGEGGFW